MCAPATLLAFAAWQAGDGTLANLAIDRALQTDPGYSMALLLLRLFTSGIAPTDHDWTTLLTADHTT